MNFFKRLNTFFDKTVDVLAFFSGFLVLFSMLSVSLSVMARYFLGYTTTWVLELNEFALLYITFLSAAWVLRIERHVIMDIVIQRLQLKRQRILNLITSTLCSAVCLCIMWFGVRLVWQHIQAGRMLTEGIRLPSAVVLFVIPFGFLLLSIQFLKRAYHIWLSLKKSATP